MTAPDAPWKLENQLLEVWRREFSSQLCKEQCGSRFTLSELTTLLTHLLNMTCQALGFHIYFHFILKITHRVPSIKVTEASVLESEGKQELSFILA